MKLGNNIQFLRNNMCLSQEELATDDIPANETDDISAIISRYLLFTQHINLNAILFFPPSSHFLFTKLITIWLCPMPFLSLFKGEIKVVCIHIFIIQVNS